MRALLIFKEVIKAVALALSFSGARGLLVHIEY
jgi:hypothetical protein